MNIIFIFLCTNALLFLLHLYLWGRLFRGKNTVMSWVLLLLSWFPVLFCPLYLYVEKKHRLSDGEDACAVQVDFKGKMRSFLVCFLGHYLIAWALKSCEIADSFEIALTCMNVFLFLWIVLCWDILGRKKGSLLPVG